MERELYLPKSFGDVCRHKRKKMRLYDAVNEKGTQLLGLDCKRPLKKALVKLKSMYVLDRVLKHPEFVIKSKINETDFDLLLQEDDEFFKFVLPQLYEVKENQIKKMTKQIEEFTAKEQQSESLKSDREKKLFEMYKKTIKEYHAENVDLKEHNKYLYEKLQEKVEEIEILRNKLNMIEEQI
jgi:hypothetical protein